MTRPHESVEDRCQICGEDNPNVLLTHHKLPRAFGGESSDRNVTTLCANCRQAITEVYGQQFWRRVFDVLDASPPEPDAEMDDREVVIGD